MPRASCSQNQTQSSSQRSRRLQLSQTNYNEEIASTQEKSIHLEEASNKLVTYVLHHLDNSKILRRTALQKHVAVKGVNWNKQFDAANDKLQNIYGCELAICDDPTVKIPSYYIKKLTPHIQFVEEDNDCHIKKIITFLIMTILFMSNGKCSENGMFEYLNKMKAISGVDEDADDRNVKNILKELSTNRMVLIENEELLWGPLADGIVSKMDILKFVSMVYNTSVESWGELHANALEQIEEKMEVDGQSNDLEAIEEEPHSSQQAGNYRKSYQSQQ